jgi:hypothetical protein
MIHIDEFDLPEFAERQKIWTTAERSDPFDVAELIYKHGLCPSRANLFCITAKERKRLQALIAANENSQNAAGEAQREYEITLAARANCTDAKKQIQRESEAQAKVSAATQLAEEIRIAKVHINGILQRFAPFIVDRETLPPVVDAIPTVVFEELTRLGIATDHPAPWAGIEEIQRPQKPRKRVAAAVNSPELPFARQAD